MSETIVEKKLPVQNWIRVDLQTFSTHAVAAAMQTALYDGRVLHEKEGKLQVAGRPYRATDAKVKIVARSNGTYDVISYISREAQDNKAPAKVAQAPEKVSEVKEKPVHGLLSKDRKKSPKKV
jgi:hypothetical protein